MFYSKTTSGFYSQAIHGDNIPGDAVEITAEQHAALLQGQSDGKQIVPDANGFPVLITPTVDPEVVEAQRVDSLWQAAHNYEYAQVSGSAVGILAMGVMQGKPKCIAVQNWIKAVWAEYYLRKATGSTDYDYSFIGPVPHSVPELMEELGL